MDTYTKQFEYKLYTDRDIFKDRFVILSYSDKPPIAYWLFYPDGNYGPK